MFKTSSEKEVKSPVTLVAEWGLIKDVMRTMKLSAESYNRINTDLNVFDAGAGVEATSAEVVDTNISRYRAAVSQVSKL